MSDLEKARNYIGQKRDAYVELIGEIRQIARKMKADLGDSVVLRVYSRGEKQGGDELKELTKIVDAIEGPVSIKALQLLHDIIGLTIVVQYPGQIAVVGDQLSQMLAGKQIKEIPPRKKHGGAYYAEHIIFESARGNHQGLRCEVQCKTVLHDAWAAKMHDLTYKPQGAMDSRLKGLVEAISMALEGLERQSEIVRDLIVARQNVEQRPFQASLKLLHDNLFATFRGEWTKKGALKGLQSVCDAIEAAEANGMPLDHAEFDRLAGEIRSAAANERQLRFCWILAVKLVALGTLPGRVGLLTDLAEMIMDDLPSLLEKRFLAQRELWSFPIGFYVVRDFARAIEYADRLLAKSKELKLTVECRWALGFNKATWLLERESVRPSKPYVAQKVRTAVDTLLRDLRAIRRFSKNGELQDTEGLWLIVFGAEKEEVRRGIEICNAAAAAARTEDAAVANAYADWRTHAGWRRYFELAERAAG